MQNNSYNYIVFWYKRIVEEEWKIRYGDVNEDF